jgi:hypothetical protein
VDGTEAIVSGRTQFTRRDPTPHIASLSLDPKAHSPVPVPDDIVLAFHARLIACLRDYLHRQTNLCSSFSESETFPISRYARLASSTNAQLQFWLSDLDGYSLACSASRRLMVAYYFARIIVNHPSVDVFSKNGREEVANAAQSFALDAAFALLEMCTAWEPKDDLPHLPWSSFGVSDIPMHHRQQLTNTDDHAGGRRTSDLAPSDRYGGLCVYRRRRWIPLLHRCGCR